MRPNVNGRVVSRNRAAGARASCECIARERGPSALQLAPRLAPGREARKRSNRPTKYGHDSGKLKCVMIIERPRSQACRCAPPETHAKSHSPACKGKTQHRWKEGRGGKAQHIAKNMGIGTRDGRAELEEHTTCRPGWDHWFGGGDGFMDVLGVFSVLEEPMDAENRFAVGFWLCKLCRLRVVAIQVVGMHSAPSR